MGQIVLPVFDRNAWCEPPSLRRPVAGDACIGKPAVCIELVGVGSERAYAVVRPSPGGSPVKEQVLIQADAYIGAGHPTLTFDLAAIGLGDFISPVKLAKHSNQNVFRQRIIGTDVKDIEATAGIRIALVVASEVAFGADIDTLELDFNVELVGDVGNRIAQSEQHAAGELPFRCFGLLLVNSLKRADATMSVRGT
jgi:hypothetical protein